ncbi:MAG: sarcosine oxidase subunit gamma [Paracoccaceae bacterium]
MANLIAKTACAGLLPISAGTCALTEMTPEAITSIAPAKGQQRLVSEALKKAYGVAFPAANRATGKQGARVIWSGAGQAFVVGPAPKPIKAAAVTDQSDAWAVMRLEGADAEAVLARLLPIDLRAASFKRGHTARTMLFHMSCSITRVGANVFDIMVFRSMAKTAVHELSTAMRSIAAQVN